MEAMVTIVQWVNSQAILSKWSEPSEGGLQESVWREMQGTAEVLVDF